MLLVSLVHHLQWLHHLLKSAPNPRNGIGRSHHLVKEKTDPTVMMAANHSAKTYRRQSHNYTFNIYAYDCAIHSKHSSRIFEARFIRPCLKSSLFTLAVGSCPKAFTINRDFTLCEEKLDTSSSPIISRPLARYGCLL